MGIYFKDPEAVQTVRELAKRRGTTITEAIKNAARKDLDSDDERKLDERLKEIQDKFAALPKTGLKADKAFYDSLNDE